MTESDYSEDYMSINGNIEHDESEEELLEYAILSDYEYSNDENDKDGLKHDENSNDYMVEFIEEQPENFDAYIDGDAEIKKPPKNEIDEYDDSIESHALVLRPAKDGSDSDTFFCLKCQFEYKTLEDFKAAHKRPNEKRKLEEDNQIALTVKAENYMESKSFATDDLEKEKIEIDEIEDLDELEPQYLDEQFDKDFEESSMHFEAIDDTEVDGDKFFFCNECQNLFDDVESAEKHTCIPIAPPRSRFSPGAVVKIFKCQECEKQFNNLKALAVHSRIHKVSKGMPQKRNARTEQATCDICNTTFHSEKNLKLHMKIHQKRRLKTVEEAIPPSLKMGYKEQDKFFCEICKKHFDQQLLTVHQAMHRKEEEHNCKVCNRQFENLPSFEMHMKVHVQKPMQVRPSKSKRINLPGQKMKFPCQYCGREFPRPHEKVRHERVHTGEKPYECEVCGKRFRVPYSLTLHLRTHTEVRPYECETCNKRFKSQPVYAHHLKTHLAERGYKCGLCEKAFRTSVQLCAHRNSHTKPFSCSECNRPFSSLYAVKVHMKTHSKSNKFHENLKHRCSVCGAVYARMFALRYHMKNQHCMELYDPQSMELHGSANTLDDDEAAELIAAASEVDGHDFIVTDSIDDINKSTHQIIQNAHYLNEDEISAQAILQNEQIIVDSFQTEEVVTDWLSK